MKSNRITSAGHSSNTNVISRFFRNRKLRKERKELVSRKEYLIANGFPIVFNGESYIDNRIAEITRVLNGL